MPVLKANNTQGVAKDAVVDADRGSDIGFGGCKSERPKFAEEDQPAGRVGNRLSQMKTGVNAVTAERSGVQHTANATSA